MTDDTYECGVCGRTSDRQWTVTTCEARHTYDQTVAKLRRWIPW